MKGREKRGKIRRKVLLPLTMTLVFFMGLFLLVSYVYLLKNIRRDLGQQYKTADILLRELVVQRTDLMTFALRQIVADRDLQSAMAGGRREDLLRLSRHWADELLSQHGISHFYFHTPEGSTFLRAHQPDRWGDPVGRETFERARRILGPAQGIELGSLGTFSLRVVIPWFVEERLIGFVELGDDMEYLIRKLHQIAPFDIIVFLRKSLLDRTLWEEGMRMLGRVPEWELFPDRVEAFHSLRNIPPTLVEELSRQGFWSRQEVAVEVDGRSFRGRLLPLLDVSQRRVGELLVLRDVTKAVENFRQSMALVILFCFLFGGSFFASAFFLLGRTDRQLDFARRQLTDEIDRAHATNQRLELEIQERRQAEAALKEIRDLLEIRVRERTAALDLQNRLLTNLVQSVDDILFVTDSEERFLLMNPSAELFFRTRMQQAAGRKLEAVITTPALRQKFREALLDRQAGQFDLEVENGGSSKGLRILQARTSVLGDQQGAFEGMIFLVQDVTQERTMDRLKSDFISTAAHELRTPMAVILGYSELLLNERELEPDQQQEFLSVIYERADAISTLLDDLLDISRIESGQPLALHRDQFPAAELFARTVEHYRKSAPAHHFELMLEDETLQLEVDRGKIWQVIENLVSNAVKYSPDGGRIRISGHQAETGYRVTVQDEGIGMTAEQVRQVFQKFYRADNSNTAIHGTGLGLTIVKHIIEAHGGTIWVESEPGKGTAVSFLLPAAGADWPAVRSANSC